MDGLAVVVPEQDASATHFITALAHRITLHAVARAAISSVPYDVVLTPFVVPLVTSLLRRLDVDPLRRL